MTDYKSRRAWEEPGSSDAPAAASPVSERRIPTESYQLGDVSVTEIAPTKKSGSASLWGWVLAAMLVVAGLVAYVVKVEPLLDTVKMLQGALSQAQTEKTILVQKVEAVQRRLGELEAEHAELAATVEVKEQALAELSSAQEQLAKQLADEIARGEVSVQQRGGDLVVDVSDQVLFNSGEAELNPRGREVLMRVGETLRNAQDKSIEVSGHTDDVPISNKIAARFPSNWELSTARATQVVRYLQDDVKIAGERLVAVGHSQYRPVARNTTKAGRHKNRRIEIALVPMPADTVGKKP